MGTEKEKQDDGLSDSARATRSAQPYLDAAWKFVGGVVGGVLGGYFFDKHFHTSPWGLIILMLLGTVGGFIGLVQAATRLGKGP